MNKTANLIAALVALVLAGPVSAETWRGIVVAPEDRCSAYDRDAYPYPQSLELDLIAGMGGRVYGPYTGRIFSDRGQTDIEHMVATLGGA